MPMMPGPLAVVTYVTIKVAGYAGFGHVLNRMLDRSVRVWKFGVVKTCIGLVAGLTYFLLIRKALVMLALIAGVLWSYLLDGAMALFYHLPGMAMAIC